MRLLQTVITTAILFLISLTSQAQQFIGISTRDYAAIQQMPTNPAWVAASSNGMEIMLFSASAMAGNNAFSFDKNYLLNGFNGNAIEDSTYIRYKTKNTKHLWANIDIVGPSVSYTYKDIHHVGFFTRCRQIVRGGNISERAFDIIGQETPNNLYGQNIGFNNAGFTTHTFSEIGFTYGRILKNDYYNVMRGGVSVKFLMGFVAGSIYTNDIHYQRKDADTIGEIQGDLTMLYSYNIGAFIDGNAQNDLTSWFNRGGKWGLGLDIGWQYEYHPDGNPNHPTPYMYSVYASLTDIGGIGYVADRGSGTYDVRINQIDTSTLVKYDYEEIYQFTERLQKDSILSSPSSVEKFRVGLPTALRFGGDYNMSEKVNVAANVLLNLRGNGGDIYKPAYVNYFNITPSFGGKNLKLSIPFSLTGFQTFTIGAAVRFGPFFIGSSSVFSTLASRKVRNFDMYAGLIWKFRKDFNGYF